MPNRSYQKGYRFEKRVQAWLVHLGTCTRAFMSRGADLVLERFLKRWTFDCKCRAKGVTPSVNELKKRCEKSDFAVIGEDHEIPYIFGPLPKFVEFCGGEKLE